MNVLKRLDSKLFDFRENPNFRASFENLLSRPDLHYEQIIGELEKIYLARGQDHSIALKTAHQLIDCVQILLLEDQEKTTPLFSEKVKDYKGIKNLISEQTSLNVFSLNHDINFEEICKYHDVPYRDGFFDEAEPRYANIANFKTLKIDQLNDRKLNFFAENEVGVNLIKLHGSLDIFAAEDKKLYLKCTPPIEMKLGGHVQEIRKAEIHSQEVCNQMQTRTVRELLVKDVTGEIQFLRRSLLSGANKFKGSFEQIAPGKFLEEFKERIKTVTQLDVIGYGFGDAHINDILKEWLNIPNASLHIYDPCRSSPPPDLDEHGGKITIFNIGLTQYFYQNERKTQTLLERTRQSLREAARERLRKKRIGVWEPSNNK